MHGDRTETDESVVGTYADAASPVVLSVVHHPDPEHIGAWRELEPGATLTLGRKSDALGPRVLDDRKLSRAHCMLKVARGAGGVVTVVDLGSRNHTTLNGLRVQQEEAGPGDVIGIGRILLLVHRGKPAYRSAHHPSLVGVGSAHAQVLLQIARVARRDTTVLILGETGTGKELVAAELHRQSGRTGTFVPVNCGALTDTLATSELFGAVRGAFTGATTNRAGLVERAEAGTLFLDEIGDAPEALQLALLRLLQEKSFRRVGSNETRRANVRFVAATHRDVIDQPSGGDGPLREDLLGRLARWVIQLAPLRERREDIPHLVRHFVRLHAGRDLEVDRGLALQLLRHHWPRNIRELDAVVERLVIEADGKKKLMPAPWFQAEEEVAEPVVPVLSLARAERPARPAREELEQRFLTHGGNIKALALELGVSRTTLYRWLAEQGVDVDALRAQVASS